MNKQIIISQLLCSRICHDLAGVTGAINAGVELIDDVKTDIDSASKKSTEDEAFDLISLSSQQIAYRLDFFRAAFAFKSESSSLGTFEEMNSLAEKYFSYGNVELSFKYGPGATSESILTNLLGVSGYRVTLLMLMIAAESLPRGGSVVMQAAVFPEGTGVGVEAIGAGARLREDVALVMRQDFVFNDNNEDVTSRNVHGYYAQLLAFEFGNGIEVFQNPGGVTSQENDGRIQFAILIPKI